MTVSELKQLCDNLVNQGYGDHSVILSNDEEGNGYHELFYPFLTDQAIIMDAIDSTGSWGQITKSNVGYALLG